jgi:hypothetical protein
VKPTRTQREERDGERESREEWRENNEEKVVTGKGPTGSINSASGSYGA